MLTLVNSEKQKIYKMYPPSPGDDYFKVTYGHIGGAELTKKYPVDQWDIVLQDKKDLGYTDASEMYREPDKTEMSIAESDLEKTLAYLQNCSRQMVSKYFKSVTPSETALSRAEEVINELVGITDVWEFNERLMELFTLLPRKTRNVITQTARSADDFAEIIERETSLLDNLSVYNGPQKTAIDGVTFDECSGDRTLKKLWKSSHYRIKNAWKVTDSGQNARFAAYKDAHDVHNTRLLFHGSRDENWWSILNKGLKIRPANAVINGSMFGSGLYFASDAAKSMGYTSKNGSKWAGGTKASGFIGVYEVSYDDPWHLKEWKDSYSTLNEKAVRTKGHDCVHAHAGDTGLLFDEIIEYNADACAIRYLLEVE